MEKHLCDEEHAATLAGWITSRGGVLVWQSQALEDMGATCDTPAFDSQVNPVGKPGWKYGDKPILHITSLAEVEVALVVGGRMGLAEWLARPNAVPLTNDELQRQAATGEASAKANAVCDYLRKIDNIIDVRHVKVMFGGKEYLGARYLQSCRYSDGMTMVRDGRAKAGEEYFEEHFYLLGQPPLKIKRRTDICFTWNCGEWYIGCHSANGNVSEFNPFGWNFILSCWHVPDGTRIDTYEKKRYLRVEMTVEFLKGDK